MQICDLVRSPGARTLTIFCLVGGLHPTVTGFPLSFAYYTFSY